MGRKPVLGLVGAWLIGATMTGCAWDNCKWCGLKQDPPPSGVTANNTQQPLPSWQQPPPSATVGGNKTGLNGARSPIQPTANQGQIPPGSTRFPGGPGSISNPSGVRTPSIPGEVSGAGYPEESSRLSATGTPGVRRTDDLTGARGTPTMTAPPALRPSVRSPSRVDEIPSVPPVTSVSEKGHRDVPVPPSTGPGLESRVVEMPVVNTSVPSVPPTSTGGPITPVPPVPAGGSTIDALPVPPIPGAETSGIPAPLPPSPDGPALPGESRFKTTLPPRPLAPTTRDIHEVAP